MRYLLDTNILLPLIDDLLPRLPARTFDLLQSHTADCVTSAASLWEMAIKSRLGKLDLPCTPQRLPEAANSVGIAILPVTPAHAVTPVTPWPDTNDPFDRILLSICQVEGLRLVTTDIKLREHPLAWRP
jgi:PIN domain nuclease of toxin-antitoxin system